MKHPSKSKTTTKRKASGRKLTAAKAAPARRHPSIPIVRSGGTKNDAILDLLRKQEGATIKALIDATRWQPHSVRGFLAGTVRKKLGLKLTSEKIDGVRRYRIEA